jgi:UPF0755 protein
MRARFYLLPLLLCVGFAALVFLLYRSLHPVRKPVVVQKPEEVHATFIEGWTNKDIANALEKLQLVQSDAFLTALDNFDSSSYSVLAFKPHSASLEGFLFPDTYFLAKQTTSEVIIKKALDNFSSKWIQATGLAKVKNGKFVSSSYPAEPLSAYEILTLASIIEKETGRNVSSLSATQTAALEQERRTVAGIFYNRLSIGQALESDATVNYVTGKSDPTPSLLDLEKKSPYNTYTHRGLPPGPICNPSLSSIEAALNPIDTPYLYFLHRQTDGQVFYAKTLEQHVANKQKYLK